MTLETNRLLGSTNAAPDAGAERDGIMPDGSFADWHIALDEQRLELPDDPRQCFLTPGRASWLADLSARRPWVRNLLYFGPVLALYAWSVTRVVATPDEPARYCGILAGATGLLAVNCLNLRSDQIYAERRYGEFHFC